MILGVSVSIRNPGRARINPSVRDAHRATRRHVVAEVSAAAVEELADPATPSVADVAGDPDTGAVLGDAGAAAQSGRSGRLSGGLAVRAGDD